MDELKQIAEATTEYRRQLDATDRDVVPAASAMQALEMQMAALDEGLGRLEDRLAAVLDPANVLSGAAVGPSDGRTPSPLVGQLQRAGETLRLHNDRLAGLIARLEV